MGLLDHAIFLISPLQDQAPHNMKLSTMLCAIALPACVVAVPTRTGQKLDKRQYAIIIHVSES